MIGNTFGSYRVTAKLGEGGMGVVYLAEHALLGRKAAVKVLLPELSRHEDLVARFFNEAKTAATLKHPALVDVFDFGTLPSGEAYIVMDFLEGESLAARIARLAPLATESAAEIARQIARGMDAAHAHGVVHRDLKPDNVFLIPDPERPGGERVKILDFGIAKLMSPPPGSKGATRTGAVIGTPSYMAPEQCRGAGAVDHRADIYSLGCILYAMLCARPPFDYEGVGEILGAHLHEAARPPRTVNPGIPAAVETAVLRALAKKPEERQQSMRALAAEIEAAMGWPAVPTSPPLSGGAANATPAPPPAPVRSRAAMAPTTLGTAASQLAGADLPGTSSIRQGSSRALLALVAGAALAIGGIAALVVGRSRPAVPPSPHTAAPAAVESPPAVPATRPAPAAGPALAVKQTPAAALTPSPANGPAPATSAPATAPVPTSTKPERAAATKTGGARADASRAYLAGVAAAAAGRDPAALESFRASLRSGTLSPEQRTDAERHVIALQRRVGQIEILCEVPGAEIRLDGALAGRTPLDRPIVVRPGAHELLLAKTGYAPVRRQIRIAPGERQALSFRLAR